MSTSRSLVAGIDDGGLDEFLWGVSSGTEDDDVAEEMDGGTDDLNVVGGLDAMLSVAPKSSVVDTETPLLPLMILFRAAEGGSGGNMISAGIVGNAACGMS